MLEYFHKGLRERSVYKFFENHLHSSKISSSSASRSIFTLIIPVLTRCWSVDWKFKPLFLVNVISRGIRPAIFDCQQFQTHLFIVINGNKCCIVAGKTRRRASESPRRPKKKRKHSKSPHILHGVIQDVPTGLDSRLELFGMDGDQDLALINFERTRETLSDSCEYPQLHRSASYFPQSTAQL